MVESTGQEENLNKYQGDEGVVLRWIKEIDLVEKSKGQESFERLGDKIVDHYRNADCLQALTDPKPSKVMFNILWSNVQIQKPACYSRMPKIVVERRFKDKDPIGRLASRIAERATSYMLSSQQDSFNYAVRSAVEDRLLPGRGNSWIKYTSEFENAKDEQGNDLLDEDNQPIQVPKPNTEKVLVEYIFWKDYLESANRNPYDIRWKARKVYLTRHKLRELCPDCADEVPLDYDPNGKKRKKDSDGEAEFLKQAIVYEIWDSESKKVYWICKGYKSRPLKVVDNPYKLEQFYPCPVPLLATTTTDSSYPTPDFKIYEKLADELDYVTKRISAIVECIRFVGATSEQFNADVKNMLKLSDGQLWPIKQWPAFVEKGGYKGVIDWMPFDNAIAALGPLIQYQQSLISQIFEITGIPDIARGATDPNETLGAQNQKLRWLGIKQEEKSRDVQRFCRQLAVIIAEILFEEGLFSDQTLWLMCGADQFTPEEQQQFPEALALLRNDRLRTFKVDIETDSTIAIDEAEEKQARMEYLSSVSQLMQQIQSISQFRPELMEPVVESALFAVRTFRTGRQLEGAWEKALQTIQDNDKAAQEQAAQQPPPPDYESQKLQLEAQALQMRGDFEAQKIQLEGQKLQMDFEIQSQKVQIEGMKVQTDAQVKATEQELDRFKTQFTQFVETQRLELDKYATVLSEREKIMEEARLSADLRMQEHEKIMKSEGGGAKSSPVNINLSEGMPVSVVHNVHNPAPKKAKKKRIKMMRDFDGSLIGESEEIDEEATENESKAFELIENEGLS